MIRRDENGAFYLIRQDDHAKLSGQLAERLGGSVLTPLLEHDADSGRKALTAIAMHDAGWPLHDDAPTLNNRMQPRDVFESKADIAMKVWTASADRAAAVDPYIGLLVSLHGLGLSAFALAEVTQHIGRKGVAYSRDKFDLNRFQHNEIERQIALRTQLGLRTDLPLNYGIAAAGSDPREDLLTVHFRTLQAMDRLSLALCCSKPPFDSLELPSAVGQPMVKVRMNRVDPHRSVIDPWIFDQPILTVSVAVKVMVSKQFANEAAFREAFDAAETTALTLAIEAGR